MLKISIEQWQDQDTKEADLLICDNNITFIAYCSHYEDIERKSITLSSLYASDIYLTDKKTNIQKNQDGGFYSYDIIAQVVNLSPPCVKLTEKINIELDSPIPKDIQVGQTVIFNVEKLNL